MPRCSKVTDDQLRDAVANSVTMAAVLRTLGLAYAGGTHAVYRRRITQLGLDTSHFTGSRGYQFKGANRLSATELLVDTEAFYRTKTYQLRRAMLEIGVSNFCAECGQEPVWCGKPLTLQIEHKNGNSRDNRKENLCFLCPNCHTQTPTYGRQPDIG